MSSVLQCNSCYSAENLKLCSRCKTVRYCSVGCQKRDWQSHKPGCKRTTKVVNKSLKTTPLPQRKDIPQAQLPSKKIFKAFPEGAPLLEELYIACATERTHEVRRLLRFNNPNQLYPKDDTRTLHPMNEMSLSPLHISAFTGNVSVIRVLIQNGANQSIVNADEETPLHLAVLAGKVEAVRLLLLDPKALKLGKYTPLQYGLAIKQGLLATESTNTRRKENIDTIIGLLKTQKSDTYGCIFLADDLALKQITYTETLLRLLKKEAHKPIEIEYGTRTSFSVQSANSLFSYAKEKLLAHVDAVIKKLPTQIPGIKIKNISKEEDPKDEQLKKLISYLPPHKVVQMIEGLRKLQIDESNAAAISLEELNNKRMAVLGQFMSLFNLQLLKQFYYETILLHIEEPTEKIKLKINENLEMFIMSNESCKILERLALLKTFQLLKKRSP